MPEAVEDMFHLSRLQVVEGKYGHCPEEDVWLFWRRVDGVEHEIAVTYREGDVVDAATWPNSKLIDFFDAHEVVATDSCPAEAERVARQTPIGDLLHTF